MDYFIYLLLFIVLVLFLNLSLSKHLTYTPGRKLLVICTIFQVLLVFKLNTNIFTPTNVSEHLTDYNVINSSLEFIDMYKVSLTGEQFSPFLEFEQEHFSFYSTSDLSNNFVVLGNANLRIHWFYLAKHLAKPKYSTPNTETYVTAPKTSILILILLFMCGDTGAAINPGYKK